MALEIHVVVSTGQETRVEVEERRGSEGGGKVTSVDGAKGRSGEEGEEGYRFARAGYSLGQSVAISVTYRLQSFLPRSFCVLSDLSSLVFPPPRVLPIRRALAP